MRKAGNNYAFIDSQNVNLAIRGLGWKLDWKRFRTYLAERFGVSQAFLFIGYVPGNEMLYANLQRMGYVCIFKPTLTLPDGTVKGNVDAELVLHTMIQYDNFEKAIIVTSDGDFHCLVEYLRDQNKLAKVLVPNEQRYSALLKRLSTPEFNIFEFLNRARGKLEYVPQNEKSSRRDQPRREPLSS